MYISHLINFFLNKKYFQNMIRNPLYINYYNVRNNSFFELRRMFLMTKFFEIYQKYNSNWTKFVKNKK